MKSKSTDIPINSIGYATDKNDCHWVHNHNTNQLLKYDSLLNLEEEFEMGAIDNLKGVSTLATNFEKNAVYAFKGGNECISIDVTTSDIEEYDYVAEDCRLVNGLLPTADNLVVFTNNEGQTESKITIFNLKKRKIVRKVNLCDITKSSLIS